MWREWVKELKPNVTIVSTWHQSESIEGDDKNSAIASASWRSNYLQITDGNVDYFLAYADADDPIQGTLVEIGMALAAGLSVYLVGTYPWGSWKHLPFIYPHERLHSALLSITKAKAHPHVRG